MSHKTALLLTGGGARGAFQAGALQAIYEIAASVGDKRPFNFICGTSAGAINASFVASNAHAAPDCMQNLVKMWGDLHTDDIFRSDIGSLGKIAIQLVSDMILSGFKKGGRVKALLDTSPLRKLIMERCDFHQIDRNIRDGVFDALELTATSYLTSTCTSFVQSEKQFKHWNRISRSSEATRISIEHILASSAIPLFFPPVKIDGIFFGDGSLRNSTPLSPTIRLGADSILVIGVRKEKTSGPDTESVEHVVPSIGRVLSVILNALFMDAVDIDIDRLHRINEVIRKIPEAERHDAKMRPIDCLYIRPSRDLGQMASSYFGELPDSMQYLIQGLGSKEEASELLSYLLFEQGYTQELAKLGYIDAMAARDEIIEFVRRRMSKTDRAAS